MFTLRYYDFGYGYFYVDACSIGMNGKSSHHVQKNEITHEQIKIIT